MFLGIVAGVIWKGRKEVLRRSGASAGARREGSGTVIEM